MSIYYLGAEVANVALSDSFNTWRVTTNKILEDAASTSSNNTFAGTLTFNGPVTFNGAMSTSGSSSGLNTTLTGNAVIGKALTAKDVTVSNTVTTSNLVSLGTITANNLSAENITANNLSAQNITANNITASSIIRANNFIGDGSLLTNAGSTVSIDSVFNRALLVPFTGISSGTMTSANVNFTLTFNPGSGQLSANSMKTSDLQDSSGRTLTIRDESGTIVWGG